jgi:hypothetical protein
VWLGSWYCVARVALPDGCALSQSWMVCGVILLQIVLQVCFRVVCCCGRFGGFFAVAELVRPYAVWHGQAVVLCSVGSLGYAY